MKRRQRGYNVVIAVVAAVDAALPLAYGLTRDANAAGGDDAPIARGAAEGRSPRQAAIWKDYERAERFGSREMGRLVYKAEVRAHWIADRPAFWYRNDVRGEREFILINAERGERGPAFDHARLAAALSKAAEKTYQAKRLPFNAIAFVNEGKAVELNVGSSRWRCDLETYRCTRVGPAVTSVWPVAGSVISKKTSKKLSAFPGANGSTSRIPGLSLTCSVI